jgi:hypothetical protein
MEEGELTEPCLSLRVSAIQATLVGGIGGLHKAGAGVVRVTRIITPLSPWSQTGTISAGFVNRQSYSAARIARSEDAGMTSQAIDARPLPECLGGAFH